MHTFAPETCHERWMTNAPRALRYKPGVELGSWKKSLDVKLRELLGVMPERVGLNIRKEAEKEFETFVETRFVFASEAECDVPCHLLIPKSARGRKVPVVICLQGHSTGMHISLGRAKSEADAKSIEGGRDFALQAVAEGYAALVLEQRCFGEREDKRPAHQHSEHPRCTHASIVAIMLGRTMIGERVWDVSRAIDCLESFSGVDTGRIGCMGNSGGGTITWYASCLEPRITVSMPSCAICTWQHSIGIIDHCIDNYVPQGLRWFEMGDLAGLIAPKPLIVVAGRKDAIFPIEPTQRNFATIEEIYEAAGVGERCRLVVGEEGHRFYPAEAWPVFRELSGW